MRICQWMTNPVYGILFNNAIPLQFVAVGIWSFWGTFWAVSGTYHGVRGPPRAR